MAPVLTKNQLSDDDSNSNDQESRRKKKRASRWAANESEKAFIPGIPTMMPSNMTQDQEKAYLSKSNSIYYIDKFFYMY
jgi:splicing factor 1